MKIERLVVATAVAFVTGALTMSAALAHHSFAAEFDSTRPVELSGKVTNMKWANPHAWIYIDVEDANGSVTNWALEMRAANGLIRRGWRPDDLPVGTVLVVEGWRARNGSPTANISSVTFEDGRRLFTGSSNPEARQE
jgi:hypothetical protein